MSTFFTGNNTKRYGGRLVMGVGAAKQVRDSYPGIDGKITTDKPVTFTSITEAQIIGWFQVKSYWHQPADLKLIKESAALLSYYALQRPDLVFHLNAPGVGYGSLDWGTVYGVIQHMPDNVLVYYVPRGQ